MLPSPTDEHITRLTLPDDSGAGAAGREFVTAQLTRWRLPPDTVDIAVLLTSELVANAVKHAPPPGDLTLALADEFVRVEVGDSSSLPPAVAEQQPRALGGRGLLLVEALAARWGWRQEAQGKVVWFTVTVRTAPPVRW
ncbi:ATP-binding protein [Winogradskya humida]|uniref:ATP-binding protein n=1 Tax=Winogradskya humida TaxID=113566 RepID=UPI00194325CC|nr:ATP-binding protein [Actinoplanes humidus]